MLHTIKKKDRIKLILFSVFFAYFVTFPTAIIDRYMDYMRIRFYYDNYNKMIKNDKYQPIEYGPFLLLVAECEKWKVELDDACGILQKESWFRWDAFNGIDRGGFQINKAHIKPGEDPSRYFDYRINIPKGVYLWSSALKKSGGNKRIALAYYNAGENCNLATYPNYTTYCDVVLKHSANTRKLKEYFSTQDSVAEAELKQAVGLKI